MQMLYMSVELSVFQSAALCTMAPSPEQLSPMSYDPRHWGFNCLNIPIFICYVSPNSSLTLQCFQVRAAAQGRVTPSVSSEDLQQQVI